LGQNELHVYAHNKPNPRNGKSSAAYYYQCRTHFRDYADTVNRKSQHPEWLDQHLSCLVGTSHTLPNLEFLSTCKQIYQEARLIPYSCNTFVFVTPSSLNTFVSKVLAPTQSRALRSIGIWTAISTNEIKDPETSWNCWKASSQIADEQLLSGLQHLQLSISVFAGFSAHDDPWAWTNLEHLGGVLEFRKFGLKEVGVAVSQTVDAGCEDESSDAKALGAYAEDVKLSLLGRTPCPL
jgi:hypothetical protein